jgi:hypothetical protein
MKESERRLPVGILLAAFQFLVAGAGYQLGPAPQRKCR